MDFLIITGMSGAGKTVIVDSLEDMGYFCIDSLPPKIIPTFAKLNQNAEQFRKFAVVADIRAGASFDVDFSFALSKLDEDKIPYKILFVDANDEILLKRFKETRRPHPLQGDDFNLIRDAITEERRLLKIARKKADYYIDSSMSSAIQSRLRILSMFSEDSSEKFNVHFMSFGFKNGVPSDADYVFDCRILPNPFYIPELKPQTGLDAPVYDYVMSFDESKDYLKKMESLLESVLPLCKKSGRSQLIVAIGCTGGHHRSVAFAESLKEYFSAKGYSVSSSHRDLPG